MSANNRLASLRVLSIAHTGVKTSIGRLRYQPLVGRHDVDLTLVVPDLWREYGNQYRADLPDGGLHVHIAPIRWASAGPAKWYLYHYRALGKFLKKTQPDVIHLWEEPWSLVALQAMLLRDRLLPRAALVLETDQNILRRLPLPFEWIRRKTLRKTDLLIARQKEAESTSRACGYKGPARFVGYGVDETIFFPKEKRRERGNEPFLIGYVGRLLRQKGLFDVLDAIALCDTDAVHFAMMGSGVDRDSLQSHAERIGIADRVYILDPQPQKEVATFMRSLDILALMSRTLPNWKEQFGRVIIEAQACGTPVIGSNSGSIPEVVGEGGWIVQEGNAHALAELIKKLQSNKLEISQRRKLGLINVAQNYTYVRVGEQLMDSYQTAYITRSHKNQNKDSENSVRWDIDNAFLQKNFHKY